MKFISCVLVASLVASATAFAPAPISTTTTTTTTTSTSLNLFGGGKKDAAKPGGGGGGMGGGMMDQLAMFKKAQEMAQKKNALDKELAAMSFKGSSDDGKVTASFKFVPTTNPMDPNPDYEATGFEFDDAFYESASPEELSTAIQEALQAGVKATTDAVTEKYATLQGDLMAAIQGGAQKPEQK